MCSEIYLKQNLRFGDTQLVAILCLLLALTLHLLCQLLRIRSNFVLRMLINIIQQTLDAMGSPEPIKDKLISSIPADIRTAEKYMDLSPTIIRFVSCPKCRAMYLEDDELTIPRDLKVSCPSNAEVCLFQEISNGVKCQTPLYKTSSINDGKPKVAEMVYCYQDFSSWLSRIVCRPGMEKKLRTPLKDISDEHKHIIRTIWDSPAVSTFLGPDNKPFFRSQNSSRLPLLLGIGFDNFNPFHNKQAGKKTSVGAIFIFCHNLEESIRYLPQYIYLVGVINGPKQPSLTQINHYFKPLIDQLLAFYERGYFFNQTPESPKGLLMQGAVFPLIMDFHALRQATGTASHNSKFFCIYCLLLLDNIDRVDPSQWPQWYSCAVHRSLAEAWFYAPTLDMRN